VDRVIAGTSTSVAAFVGATETGRANTPARCASFADYEQTFGGLVATSELGYAILQFFANGGTDAIVVSISNGRQPLAERAIAAMSTLAREGSFNLLCIPGVSDPAVLQAAAEFCTAQAAFFIADAPAASPMPADMLALLTKGDVPKSDNAAIYYPWIQIAPPDGGKVRRTAPSGTIAGLYARVDKAAGVWKSPAGTSFPLLGVAGLTHVLNDQENGELNSRGINCIRTFRGSGAVAWGARTLGREGSEWKYIAVRRLGLYIEQSIRRGLEWTVSEANAAPLWTEIRRVVDDFMIALWRQGALLGSSPQDAYFVKCGTDTTTQSDMTVGIVNLIVGFAPLKPAEFVIVTIRLTTAV
jgi:uncharacterized protein